MKREEVRDFLEGGVNALDPPLEFGYGRLSEFNPASVKGSFPKVWQLTSSVTSEAEFNQAPVDTWEIELLIAEKDRMDSSAEEYEHIIDHCDLIAQKLVYQYRASVSGYKDVTLSGFVREPFVKTNGAAVMSGVTLRFSLVVQNKTNVC